MTAPKALPIDVDYLIDVMFRLLRTPSPAGRTDEIMHLIGSELEGMKVEPELTRRGALIGVVNGAQNTPDRAIVVHADTLGIMVRAVKPNGRLRVVPIGTHPARMAEGARVLIFTDDPDRTYTGTVLPLKASGHAFGDAVDVQRTAWEQLEVRIDALTTSAEETHALGIDVGDFIAYRVEPELTDTGFIVSRHLDGKAGVATALASFKAVVDAGLELPVSAHLFVTIAEEVGLGASSGLHPDVAETLAVDNAVVAEGQMSEETAVTVCMQDSSGPMDYHLTRKLLHLAEGLRIPARRDVYGYYRSDSASALEAGFEVRSALVGYGVDASHGHERTHREALEHLGSLLTAYLQTPLTFHWDEKALGRVGEFPHQFSEPLRGPEEA